MKNKVLVLISTIILLIPNLSIQAELTASKYNPIYYRDVVTGEEVVFNDDSETFEKMMKVWLNIAGKTFNYHDGTLTIQSIEESKEILTIDFSKEFNLMNPEMNEFDLFMWSLEKTVYENSEAIRLIITVDGKELEGIGKYDYSKGINLVEFVEKEIKVSIPDDGKTLDPPDPVIVIDPGHGGVYPGATAVDGTSEKTITLAVSNYLKSDLQNKGATVYMTRTTDTQLDANSLNNDLELRAEYGNNKDADIFLSIHCNASNNSSADGTETYYPYYHNVTTSQNLADDINDKISSRHNLDDRGINQANFVVLRDTDMTAVLVETAFISNTSDYSKLDSSADRDAMAYSIYLGVRDFWWGY